MKYDTQKKIELLAPAGSFESLKAAVLNGADAIYLGGGKFNARINASNFSEEDLCNALDYAHERGVKIYITLNTLLKNEEIKAALRFAAYVYHKGADAVIVQDQGLLSLLKKYLPDLPIHASTQMTLANSPSIRSLEDLGVKRVVLPRELSLKEIETISQNCSAELEVFAHGALCVSYSGQCLMSSFIGGRSGNRGLCAQPCRLPWSLSLNSGNYGRTAYLISPKDLMAIDLLPQLNEAGVSSVKLEGRMKSPEYVAIVTSIYRKYIDFLESSKKQKYIVSDDDREKLLQAFNRGGFTASYLKGDRNYKNLVYVSHPKNQGVLIGKVSDVKPLYAEISLDKQIDMGDGLEIIDDGNDVQSLIVTDIVQNGRHSRSAEPGKAPWIGDIKTPVKKGSKVYRTMSKTLFNEARQTYERGEAASVPLDMRFSLKTGEKAGLEVSDDFDCRVVVKSELTTEKAINRPLSAERIREQLQKTGDTPYCLRNLEIETDDLSTIPISTVNAMRREALEKLKFIRLEAHKKPLPDWMDSLEGLEAIPDFNNAPSTCSITDCPGNNLSLSVFFYEAPSDLKRFDGMALRVYIPLLPRKKLEQMRCDFKGELFLWTPSILKDDELFSLIGSLKETSDLWDGLLYGSIGALQTFKRNFPEKYFCADYSMNLFNNEALVLQKRLGAETVTLSPELRLSEVERFDDVGIKQEALVYGRIALMTMEHCPSSMEYGCSGLCASCNSRNGYLKDRMGEVFPYVRDPILKRTQILNAMPMLMDDTDALTKTCISLLRLTFTTESIETCQNVTRYFYNKLKGIEDARVVEGINSLKDKGFTKGHWFRGV